MKKYNKEKHATTGGWLWSSTWSSYALLKGMFRNGAKDTNFELSCQGLEDDPECNRLCIPPGYSSTSSWDFHQVTSPGQVSGIHLAQGVGASL
jgi:hypothetical protein